MLFLSACNENKNPLETTPQTSCSKNSECWCRSFDGARFHEGNEPSKCVNGKCNKCFYD